MTKKASKHIPNREVRNVDSKKHRIDREEKQKANGDKVVMWVFGVLIALAVIYMVWSMYVVQ